MMEDNNNKSTKKNYQDVVIHDNEYHDDDDEDNNEDDDNGRTNVGDTNGVDEEFGLLSNSNPTRKQRSNINRILNEYDKKNNKNKNVMIYSIWIMIGVILLMAVFILLTYRNHNGGFKWIANSNNDLYGDDDDGFYERRKQDRENKKAKNHPITVKQSPPPNFIHYDPLAREHWNPNPFDLYPSDHDNDYYGSPFVPAVPTIGTNDNADDDDDDDQLLGYFMEPNIVNNTLVFISEGDLYVTNIDTPSTANGKILSSMKVTTTVGNVRTPKLHPTLPIIAYTATYTGRRDVYLLDLRYYKKKSFSSIRVTYWNGPYGVHDIIGWKEQPSDDNSGGSIALIFSAASIAVSLPDSRLYEITLAVDNDAKSNVNKNNKKNDKDSIVVLQTNPVPLAQAIDTAVYDNCYYFTRVTQSSHTIRYVGGTVESLWKWCSTEEENKKKTDQLDLAIPITTDYNGTSKSPNIYKDEYLFFLSDRQYYGDGSNKDKNNKKEWIPSTMNLWALPLSSLKNDGDEKSHNNYPNYNDYIQITQISCHFNGKSLMEYSIDPITNNIILRIGATLYKESSNSIEKKLTQNARSKSFRIRNLNEKEEKEDKEYKEVEKKDHVMNDDKNSEVQELKININSDFHEHQERIIPITISDHFGSGDVFETAFSSLSMILTLRGQTWVVPVIENNDPATYNSNYQGAGMNLPQRSYRVIPGHQMGGVIRVLTTKYVPLLLEQQQASKPSTTSSSSTSDRVKARKRRLAIVLATDPLSETSEHAFYLIETQSDMTPNFLNAYDRRNFPLPIVGGHRNGGSTNNGSGGLGSIVVDSVKVSPCGRRIAWIDTDGRICVMTIPLNDYYKYQPNYYYDQLKQQQQQSNTAGIIANNTNTNTTELHPPQEPPIVSYKVLPNKNENGEPMIDPDATVSWSPGGRYLAVGHTAINQFSIITIVDCGDPNIDATKRNATAITSTSTTASGSNTTNATRFDYNSEIQFGRMVQVTPDRFNSFSPYWGTSPYDIYQQIVNEEVSPTAAKTTTLSKDSSLSMSSRKNVTTNVTITSTNTIDSTSKGKDDDDEDKTIDNPATTTLYFLTDRDIVNDVGSPWGNRAPMPHFKRSSRVYALPLLLLKQKKDKEESKNKFVCNRGYFSGGAAAELFVEEDMLFEDEIEILADGGTTSPEDDDIDGDDANDGDKDESDNSEGKDDGDGKEDNVEEEEESNPYPQDPKIYFGTNLDFEFGRHAYRMVAIPHGNYMDIVSQTNDDGSLVLLKTDDSHHTVIQVFLADSYPSDAMEAVEISPISSIDAFIVDYGLSTTRGYFYFVFSDDSIKVIPNTAAGVASILIGDADKHSKSIADTDGIGISVWPQLEYQQIYNDAWRMLRDYYYDVNMTGIDWLSIHGRYKSLVSRCTKREELDDVLVQMASEASALHVFVFGGEYNSPEGASDPTLKHLHEPANLGVEYIRNPEWHGYEITSIAERDPDFNVMDGSDVIYSPLHDQTLSLSGQRGLQVGDIIIAINGESVINDCPDINMLLRGKAGQSIRLDVLRLSSSTNNDTTMAAVPEPVITVPLSTSDASDLRYQAWEWKTRKLAKQLAADAGFTVGYMHLRSMSKEDENAFARGFYEDYNKDAMILDVRHNLGGSIDSWILDALQRKAWQFWFGRVKNITNGGLGWDEHFAFRGHLIVLIDEKTSSDGEGVARGVSELGIGRLLGTRTWGGGIWLAEDNILVDGGIATAPDTGTYNKKFGWGLGIEQMGVTPDIIVDNNPRSAFDGIDTQLTRAIDVLKQWLIDEPVVLPIPDENKRDMSYHDTDLSCS